MSQTQNFNLKKGNETMLVLKRTKPIFIKKNVNQPIKVDSNSIKIKSNIYTEKLLYQSTKGDFMVGTFPLHVMIYDRFYTIAKFRLTIAKCVDLVNHRVVYEKTSEKITKLIGNDKYNTLLNALCAVTDTELKVKAIMALLSDTKLIDNECQTDCSVEKELKDAPCQTNETSMEWFSKFKQRRRIKRNAPAPYVVKDLPRKLVIHPETFMAAKRYPIEGRSTSSIENLLTEKTPELPELKLDLTDNSNCSVDNFSLKTGLTDLVLNNAEKLYNTIAEHTVSEEKQNPTRIELMDGSTITVTVKPEDLHHIATPEILKNCTHDEKRQLLEQQLYIDFKLCLRADEDGNLPIHNAVMSKDVHWLRRQCIVLKKRNESLDIMAGNQTALQMSIIQESEDCTRLLLQQGADPCCTDDEYHRNSLHFAAERAPEQLCLLIDHCKRNARTILSEHELRKPELAGASDEELGKYLLKTMCLMSDTQGYTPLMLASKIGSYTNVKILLEAVPESVNHSMPTTGNTALFLAVEDACLDAANRGATQKLSDPYHQTISLLLEHGANPEIENDAGFNISMLLSEHNNSELSMLIANKTKHGRYLDGINSGNYSDLMLFKDNDGNIGKTEIKPKKATKTAYVDPNKVLILTKEDNGAVAAGKEVAPKTIVTVDPKEAFIIVKDDNGAFTKLEAKPSTSKEKPVILQNIPLGNVNLKKKKENHNLEAQSSANFSKEFAKFATNAANKRNDKNPALKTIINLKAARGRKNVSILKRKSTADPEAGPSKKNNENN